MNATILVISGYLNDRKLEPKRVAALCGWSEKKMSAILKEHQKLNAADYGVLCEALEVPYDSFYKQSKGISVSI